MAPVLSCRKVGFTYRNQSMAALTDVDLDVSPGELVSLAGPNGAGKSTLVRCASGIVPQMLKGRFSGQVLVKGRPVSETRVAELAGVVGTVFQDFENQLFSTNVRLEMAFGMENIGLDRPTMIERIDQVAARVGLGHLMNREPHSLSGGQKQRLALATVLCVRPELLLADEPTTDLDPIGKGRIFEILAHLKAEGHGLLLVEHDSEHLIESDRVVLLHAGQVTEDGPPAGVLADPATCYRHGIFPPQLFELFARLNLPERPCSIDAAQTALVHHGFRPVAESGPADPPLPEAPLIRLENVVYSYSGGPPVLDALSLDIREGDFLALLGANGSGKTTLVKHLNGLIRPQNGGVWFRDRPVHEIGTAGMGRVLGLVFQNPDHMLFAATVREEAAFGPRNHGFSEGEIDRRVASALETVGLTGREDLDPFIMTKGDRQKLAVASILASEPEVLVLDEPTTGLDAKEQAAMMDLLARLNQAGHTIIIITHSVRIAARYARRVVLLENGRVLAEGPARDVFARTDLLERTGLEAPPAVRLGLRFGLKTLDAAELEAALTRSGS